MTPTRAVVESWQALAASALVDQRLTAAESEVTRHTDRAARSSAELASAGWSGGAHTAADNRVQQECHTNRVLSTALTTVAEAARHGLTELHYTRVALLATVGNAEADGCAVSDSWVVTARGDGADGRAADWACLIAEKLGALDAADSRCAQSIAQAATAIPVRAGGGGDGTVLAAVPLIAIGVADLALMAAYAAGLVSVGAILFFVSQNFPSINLQDVLDILPSSITEGGPGQWEYPNRDGMSDRARAYEEQVTGTPAGTEYAVPRPGGRDVRFDGWDPDAGPNGTLVEAKGPGYEWLVGKDGAFKPGTGPAESIPDQLKRQHEAAAAAGVEVEWRVAERRVAEAIEDLILEADYDNITVKHVPPN